MNQFLERYQNGQHEQVWRDMLNLAGRVTQDEYRADVSAVISETMRRARHNIEIIVPRLKEIGYHFGALKDDPVYWAAYEAYTPPSENTEAILRKLEARIGPLPLAFREWHLQVGQVSLLGYHPDWPEPYEVDPLYISPMDEEHCSYGFFQYEEYLEDTRDYEVEDSTFFSLCFSPDRYHKANVSGGPEYAIALSPCEDRSVDGLLRDEWHNTTFVDYLRICFRWGGFPGFENLSLTALQSEHVGFLTESLLPI